MKYFSILLLILIIACQAKQLDEEKTIEPEATLAKEVGTSYDSTLAKKFEADQYGMKKYIMAFLKTGPNRPQDSAKAVELQAAHMANIGRLAEEGKLVLAGPFYGDNKGEFRGIYIFNTSSIDSARSYTESDPAIQYGSLTMELINWYGSAALMGVNEVHKKLAEQEI